jgi:hypothetical protein
MMNPEQIQKMDQATALIAETYPPMLRRFYMGCISEGFAVDQALALTVTLLQSVMGTK